jgi:hypothetical protein
MQSARRASEIHELRTGRALRVTETEVVNEEMYEEITAVSTDRHLWRADWNTRSDDFDRRLLAYLTSQRSNRGALDHTLPGSWKEQRPDSAAFVDPDVLQGASFPQHMTDVTRRNSRHTPYPSASWELQPRNHTYQPVMPFNDYNSNQQFMGPPQSPWSDSSRRMSLPTTAFAPRPYQSPTWTSTPPSDYPPSPLQRSDSAIDQPDGLNPIQQPDPKNQWQASKLATGSLTDTLLPALPLGNAHLLPSSSISLHNSGYQASSPTSTTASPKHDFTDRRYSYNPNGKSTTTPGSSIQQSSSVTHTPHMSWNSSMQTPSPLLLSNGSPDLTPLTAHPGKALSLSGGDFGDLGLYGAFVARF